MLVRDVMTREPETIRPDVAIHEAAEKMATLNVGITPVSEKERVLGVVTDRDITIRATAKEHSPSTTRVRDVMSSDLVCCFEDDDIQTAVRLIEERRVRRLPVLDLDRSERLVGIVTLGDLAVREEVSDKTHELLREVSEPTRPIR